MTGYIFFYSHPDFSKKKKREEKKASIQITYARWAQAFKNALSFSQSSNLETVEQVQVTILFLSTAQFFTYTLVVLTVVLLSRFQMNPQKLIYLKLNIHKKTRGIQMLRAMQKGWSGWRFHWVPCLFGVAESRTWLSNY